MTVGEPQPIAELLRLRRTNIKSRQLHIEKADLLPIVYFVEPDPFSILRQLRPRQQHLRHHLDDFARYVVTIDMEFPAVKIFVHQRSNPPDHPDRSHDMIGVPVRDEHAPKPFKGDFGALHLPKDAVAAARVGQKIFVVRRTEQETGIVALSRHCRART